jgi:hypothetical protein
MTLRNRYQIYPLLVDACFWLSVLYCLRMLGKMAGLLPERFPAPFDAIYYLAVLCNFALAILVVTARFLRDEYAERIWQQAAQRFVYFLTIIPLAIGIGLTVVEDSLHVTAQSDLGQALTGSMFYPGMTPETAFFGGAGFMIILVGAFGPIVFVFLYKWCLWRDGR